MANIDAHTPWSLQHRADAAFLLPTAIEIFRAHPCLENQLQDFLPHHGKNGLSPFYLL